MFNYNNNFSNCMPRNLSIVVDNLSTHFQVDKFLVIPALLGICSSVIHNKMAVEVHDPITGSSFEEPLSLFTLGIADSSERKTPVLKWLLKPVHEHLDMANIKLTEQIQEEEALRRAWEIKLKKLRKQATTLEQGSLRLAKVLEEILEFEKKVARPLPTNVRLYLQDTTASAAVAFMQEQAGHGMFIADAEGGSFDAIFNEHRLMEVLLSGFSRERISLERSSRPSIDIATPHAGICILTQKTKLEKLIKKPYMWDEGFIPRCLIFMAQSQAGYRHEAIGAQVHPSTEHWWKEQIKYLLDLPFKEDGAEYTLHLSNEAADYWCQIHNHLEQGIRRGDFPRELIPWVGKAKGIMARLAAIYHCFESINALEEEIPLARMHEASNLIQCVIPHMFDVYNLYDVISNPVHAAITKIVDWLRNENGTIDFFLCREMYRYLRIPPDVAHEACRQLQQQGVLYLNNINYPAPQKPGRRGTPVYHVDYNRLYSI